MRVESNQSVAGLRLTQPAQAVDGAPAAQPVEAVRPQPTDSHSFESIYVNQLPRVQITEAHKKLEQLRKDLVAAKVNVPIHFEQPGQQPQGSNPYSISFVRFAGSPAELNTRATDQAAAPTE